MAAFDFAKVKDPTFFKENVLNAHASFRTYASREEYRTGSSSLALKLDGIWKFAYAKNYTSAIPGFEKTDYDCSGWDDIHVPAHIQMEGYDIPQYANMRSSSSIVAARLFDAACISNPLSFRTLSALVRVGTEKHKGKIYCFPFSFPASKRGI